MSYTKGQFNFDKDFLESERLIREVVNPILKKHEFRFIRGSNSEDREERKQWDCLYEIGKNQITSITMEHKTDFLVKKTHNIFVENKYRGKPSGIITSTANYWTYLIKDPTLDTLNYKLYLINTHKFRKLTPLAFASDAKGGDRDKDGNKLARGYLFEWSQIKDKWRCMN